MSEFPKISPGDDPTVLLRNHRWLNGVSGLLNEQHFKLGRNTTRGGGGGVTQTSGDTRTGVVTSECGPAAMVSDGDQKIIVPGRGSAEVFFVEFAEGSEIPTAVSPETGSEEPAEMDIFNYDPLAVYPAGASVEIEFRGFLPQSPGSPNPPTPWGKVISGSCGIFSEA